MDPSDLAEARRLMELEYRTARETILKFDDKRFRTREFAVAVAGALLALAGASQNSSLGLIAAGSVLFFAYIDIWYMGRQREVIIRSDNLEKYMEAARRGNDAETESYRFGFGHVFNNKFPWRKLPSILAKRPQMLVFYVGLLLATVLTTVLLWMK